MTGIVKFSASHHLLKLTEFKLTHLNDKPLEESFQRQTSQHELFDGVPRDKSENLHWFGLTNAVDSVDGLQVHLRVPVRVEQDDSVCGDQVDP